MFVKNTKLLILGAVILALMAALSGCGGGSPAAAGGGGGGGGGTGTGTISGSIFSLVDPTKKNLAAPLASATIIATNATNTPVTATSAANGTYSIPGLGATTTFSAAATGYQAQTLAGVPTSAGQDMNLQPFSSLGGIAWMITASTTVTGTVTLPALPAGTGVVVVAQDVAGNIWGSAPVAPNGTYSMIIDFWNNTTVGNVTIYAVAVDAGGTFKGFGYTTANITTATTTLPAVSVATVTTTPMTVSVTNIPAAATSGFISVGMQLPTGVVVWLNSATGGPSSWNFTAPLPTILVNSSAPNNIAGVSFVANAQYNDVGWTFSADANRVGLPLAPVTINLLNIPTLASPVLNASGTANISAAAPSTFTWNAVPGAAQYSIWVNQWGPVTLAYAWEGDTAATSITKPLFAPANGGNLIAGQVYNGGIQVSDVVIVGPTTNTAAPMNPLSRPNALTAPSVGQPGGYVYNNPNYWQNINRTTSYSSFGINAI